MCVMYGKQFCIAFSACDIFKSLQLFNCKVCALFSPFICFVCLAHVAHVGMFAFFYHGSREQVCTLARLHVSGSGGRRVLALSPFLLSSFLFGPIVPSLSRTSKSALFYYGSGGQLLPFCFPMYYHESWSSITVIAVWPISIGDCIIAQRNPRRCLWATE